MVIPGQVTEVGRIGHAYRGFIVGDPGNVLLPSILRNFPLVVGTNYIVEPMTTRGYQAHLLNKGMVIGGHGGHRKHPRIKVVRRVQIEIHAIGNVELRCPVCRSQAADIVIRGC